MRVELDTPQPIEKLRKVYRDNVTFISDTTSYPLVTALEFSGDYLSAMKKRAVPVKVGKKVDKAIAKYEKRLTRAWNKNQSSLLSSLKSSITKDTSLSDVVNERDPYQRAKLYRQYLLDHKGEILNSNIDELKEDLRNAAALSFLSVYMLGKNRGQILTHQELSDDVTKEDREILDEKEEWNEEYLAGLTAAVLVNIDEALDDEYDSPEELESAIGQAYHKEQYRLPLFAAAIGSVLLAAGMAQAAKEVRAEDPETGELLDTPKLDPDTDLPIGAVITGGIWHTSHDDAVCDGCEGEDGKWLTWDEFEQEAGTNECLTRCRCIELFEPTEEQDEKAVDSGDVQKHLQGQHDQSSHNPHEGGTTVAEKPEATTTTERAPVLGVHELRGLYEKSVNSMKKDGLVPTGERTVIPMNTHRGDRVASVTSEHNRLLGRPDSAWAFPLDEWSDFTSDIVSKTDWDTPIDELENRGEKGSGEFNFNPDGLVFMALGTELQEKTLVDPLFYADNLGFEAQRAAEEDYEDSPRVKQLAETWRNQTIPLSKYDRDETYEQWDSVATGDEDYNGQLKEFMIQDTVPPQQLVFSKDIIEDFVKENGYSPTMRYIVDEGKRRAGALTVKKASDRTKYAVAFINASVEQRDVQKVTSGEVDTAASETDSSPTQAQKESGNYKKGHITLHGLDVSIENPRGSTRSGTSRDGKKWSTTMKHHYGYIKSTKGGDKEQVDVFIGDNPDSNTAFVVDQIVPDTGKFDEHKVMLGFNSKEEARQAYLANYQEGWGGLGEITVMDIDFFKEWVLSRDAKNPVSDNITKGGSGSGSWDGPGQPRFAHEEVVRDRLPSPRSEAGYRTPKNESLDTTRIRILGEYHEKNPNSTIYDLTSKGKLINYSEPSHSKWGHIAVLRRDGDKYGVEYADSKNTVQLGVGNLGQKEANDLFYALGSEISQHHNTSNISDVVKGGQGSGNFGHAGRPGEVGGSGEGGPTHDANGNPIIEGKLKHSSDGNYATHNGKKIWGGVVSLIDGAIEQTATYQKVKDNDFHHGAWVKPNLLDRLEINESMLFWVTSEGAIEGWNSTRGDFGVPKQTQNELRNQLKITPSIKKFNEFDSVVKTCIKNLQTLLKGGAGSGSWNAPGDPRFAHQGKPQEQQVSESARSLASRAQQAESKISPLLETLAQKTEGTIRGREFRLKTEESLMRKIKEQYLANPNLDPETIANSIGDSVRYTLEYPVENYVQKVQESIETLKAQGHTTEKVKNYWEQDDPYQGINVVMKSPEGHTWELQFHTPDSFDLKQNKTHPVYEQFRTSTSPQEKQSLYNKMVQMASAVAAPAGVLAIGVMSRQLMKALAEGARYFAIRPNFNQETSGLIRLQNDKDGLRIEYLSNKGFWEEDPELLSFLMGSEAVDEIDDKTAGKLLHEWRFTEKVLKGGSGSGNFGHAGRPGEVGGSGSGGATVGSTTTTEAPTTGQNVASTSSEFLSESKFNPSFVQSARAETDNAKKYLEVKEPISKETIAEGFNAHLNRAFEEKIANYNGVVVNYRSIVNERQVKLVADKAKLATATGEERSILESELRFAEQNLAEDKARLVNAEKNLTFLESSEARKGIQGLVNKIVDELSKAKSVGEQKDLMGKIHQAAVATTLKAWRAKGERAPMQRELTDVYYSITRNRNAQFKTYEEDSLKGYMESHNAFIIDAISREGDTTYKYSRRAVEGDATKTIQGRPNFQAGRDWILNNFHPAILASVTTPVKWEAKRGRGGGGRSWYRASTETITLAQDDRPGTIPHEFVHHLERQVPEISSFFEDYYTQRTGMEQPVKMSKIKRDSGYSSHEYTRPDKFADVYMGHVNIGITYGGGESRRGGEIFSQAVALLSTPQNAARLYQKDPELFGITMSILKGNIPSRTTHRAVSG